MYKVIYLCLIFKCSIVLGQQNGTFITDVKTGCKVWSDNYSPEDSICWKGNCKDKFADGFGTLTWYQKKQVVAKYIGQLKKGNPNGKGKYEINNYAILQGNFVNGALQGNGVANYTSNGQIHKGIFSQGVLNGKGEIAYNDGRKLVGNFVAGTLLNLDDAYLKQIKKTTSPIIDSANIYLGDNNSTSLFYYTIAPKQNIKGCLVLCPSAFETTESVISCNKFLIQNCFNKGIMTAVISANFNRSLSIDPFAFRFFNVVFFEIQSNYKIPKNAFVLGGLSLGGMNALRYTQMANDANYNTTIKPLGVFGVDPPVDEMGLYQRAEDEVKLFEPDSLTLNNGKRNALIEGKMLVNDYKELYGGAPSIMPKLYVKHSPFTRTEKDGGNAKFLLNTPTLIYCDPDINWYLKNRNRDFYHINASDQTALINFLTLQGNERASFVSAIGKGFRLDGTRHPHSWSLINANNCTAWLLDLFKNIK
jgi:hypothetical protein